MELLIKYLSDGHGFIELFTAILVIAAVILGVEKFLKWVYNLFLKMHRRKKGEEDELAMLNKNTTEIKNLSESIENLATLINKQYRHLDKKIDEQKERLNEFDNAGKRRDCAILRDRILGGMRYFCQNTDSQGSVHISITDHENMEHLFEEYFDCNGNGTVKSIYENEFKTWIIDN